MGPKNSGHSTMVVIVSSQLNKKRNLFLSFDQNEVKEANAQNHRYILPLRVFGWQKIIIFFES